MFEYLVAKYHTEIILMSELTDKKIDQQEVFEEITSLLHRTYASRRKKRKQKSKNMQAFKNLRTEKTKLQYEYLVERYVVRSNDKRYAIPR